MAKTTPPIDEKLIQALSLGVKQCSEIIRYDFDQMEPAFVRQAIATLLLVHLNDVLRILDFAGHRLSYNHDLPDGVDVTDQVKAIRDALCHIGSGRRNVDEFKAIINFGYLSGRVNAVRGGEQVLCCPYEDDQAILMGNYRLLVRRHIHLSVNEAVDLGPKIAKENGIKWDAWS